MPGIYIHIPYCKTKCSYCDFYSTSREASFPVFVENLRHELAQRSEFFGELSSIETIYFGGGTPSLLASESVGRILETINSIFPVSSNPEITLEANPDDLSLRFVIELRKMGINRLSLGIQSFHDNDLIFLGRRHNASQSHASIEMALAAGINNISIDLIYGLPSSAPDGWERNLEQAFGLAITHLSCYHLTYEPHTPLTVRVERGDFSPVSDEQSANEFKVLRDISHRYNFEHYEVSNLARSGYRSRHNTAYWQGVPYLGVGPSAHSFDGARRYWNPRSIRKWEAELANGMTSVEKETLTMEQKQNEYLLTSLRTSWGVSAHELRQLFGNPAADRVEKVASRFITQGLMELHAGRIRIKPDFYLISDGIICYFMVKD